MISLISSCYPYRGLIREKKITTKKSFFGQPKQIIDLKSYRKKYNDQGLLAEIDVTEGNNTKRETFKYKYDDQNNWIERMKFKGGTVENIITREIKYFD